LQKGAYIEVEGELRYREYTPTESDRSVRVAEIHANSILALDRSDRQPVPEARASYEKALALARQESERRFLTGRLEELK
jgi:predicted RNA polymerase sigma factor